MTEPLAQPGHMIHTLMEEHRIILNLAAGAVELSKKLADLGTLRETSALNTIAGQFRESQLHYQREENVLFPMLQKHGITGPPTAMWIEHDQIRALKGKFYALLEVPTASRSGLDLLKIAEDIDDLLHSHFAKENTVLFPAAMKVISDREWIDMLAEAHEIGYCSFTPDYAKHLLTADTSLTATIEGSGVKFDTGTLSLQQLEGILNTLPVDISFVDQDDKVRYFNKPDDRIFIRTKANLGLNVRQCHPAVSVHKVTEILEEFKGNRRDSAEFWITVGGKFLYIRFFAVRSPQGTYLGTMEVVQDITQARGLQGQKRLLND
jgi:uncharacterized protein